MLVGTFDTLRNRPVPVWLLALQCPVPASAGLAAGTAMPNAGQCQPGSRRCSAQCRPSGPNWPPVPSAQLHCLSRGCTLSIECVASSIPIVKYVLGLSGYVVVWADLGVIR